MSNPSPILIFINPKSGGKVGKEIIAKAEFLENVHIVQLPEQSIEWTRRDHSLLFDPNLRIIIAGGDGSVNWVVQMIVDFYGPQGEFKPPFGILPIGTGNDMSRNVGWGGYFGHCDVKSLPKFLDRIRNCQNIKQLDVWQKVHQRTDIPDSQPERKYMVNYFSIGVDAKIAMDFENCRRACPGCFCCRCSSKTWYGPMALGSCCCMPLLNDFMKGKYQEPQEAQSPTENLVEKDYDFSTFAKTLVFHNIFSMYCGKDTWHDYKNRPRNFYDGLVEVSSCAGFWALTGIQIGINTYNNIGRIRASEFETFDPVAFQIDGEAFIVNGPAKFSLSHYCTYPILVAKEKAH